MKEILGAFIVIFISISLTGCDNPDMGGIVTSADNNTVLVADNLSVNRYKAIKDKSSSTENMFEVMKQEVSETSDDINLTSFTYEDADKFKAGDEVDVWIKGGIAESFPGQGDARKIEAKK